MIMSQCLVCYHAQWTMLLFFILVLFPLHCVLQLFVTGGVLVLFHIWMYTLVLSQVPNIRVWVITLITSEWLCITQAKIKLLSHMEELVQEVLVQLKRFWLWTFLWKSHCDLNGNSFSQKLHLWIQVLCTYECFFRESGLENSLPQSLQSRP